MGDRSRIIWEEGEQSNQLMLRKQNKEHLELLRYKISRTIQTLFSFEEDSRVCKSKNAVCGGRNELHIYPEVRNFLTILLGASTDN